MNQNADSTVTQDYLKAVWALEEWGGSASVTALAKRMQVANSTASENVHAWWRWVAGASAV